MEKENMAITRYESYYAKILEQIREIKENNAYNTESIAFAHWYLEKQELLDNQEIAESIIDGDGDLGIDAILVDEDNAVLSVYQFKFPSKKESINLEIDQSDILKTWNGFLTLISNNMEYNGRNEKYLEYKKQLKESFISSFRINFVSFNKGVVANKEIIENCVDCFVKDTGSNILVRYENRDIISNIYERINRKNKIKISLKYKQMQSAYNVQNRNIDSLVGFVNGKDLVESVSDYMATIFDENIRLYEYGSEINGGMSRTSSSHEQADMFYFYNNGIVFICDDAKNSPSSNIISLEGTSVVNGCQTLNVLYDSFIKGKLRDEVCILVRIIVISDYNERMRITEYLNSQTPIRGSYFISNHTIIRELQKDLLDKGIFFERQVNEYEYMSNANNINAKVNRIFSLEKTLQYYVAYWVNKYASLAKREKNALFDKNKIEELLAEISADKVIEAYDAYISISEILTKYRKTRRNSNKDDFAVFLGMDQDVLLDHIEEFRYMNTGDIILMNAYANLKQRYKELNIMGVSEKDIIVDAIFVVKDIIKKEDEENTALLTKNGSVFTKVQDVIKGLNQRYSVEF